MTLTWKSVCGPKPLAVAAVAFTAWMAHLPVPPPAALAELARRFSFEKHTLPGPAAGAGADGHLLAPKLQHLEGYLRAFLPTGAALVDLDGNGLPNQACVTDPFTGEVWVHSLPGKADPFPSFKLDLSSVRPDPRSALPTGCLPGDFNEDGLTDLLVYFWGRTPVMFLQQPGDGPLSSGRFHPVELVAGHQRWYTQSVTSADVDGDGHLDLIVANYFPDDARVLDDRTTGPSYMNKGWGAANNGAYNRLFLKDPAAPGAATFVEAAGAFGDSLGGSQWTIAVGAADLDGDQLPEILFVNDHGADRLLHNRSTPGHAQFALVENRRDFLTPKSKTFGLDAFHGMGLDFGDLTRSGNIDIAVSNWCADYLFHQSNFAWINTGEVGLYAKGRAPFADRSEALGLARTASVPWDLRLGDFANDGTLEVFQSVGFMRGQVDRRNELHEMALMNDLVVQFPEAWHDFDEHDEVAGHAPNTFFAKGPDGRYVDIGAALGFNEAGVSRGAAVADTDGDGLISLLVTHQHAPPSFYRNTTKTAGRFLGLHLRLPYDPVDADRIVVVNGAGRTRGGPPSRPAVGATVTVETADGTRVAALVDGGSGVGGKSAPEVHVGLGALPADAPLTVRVSWRDSHGLVHRGQFMTTPGLRTVWLGSVAAVKP